MNTFKPERQFRGTQGSKSIDEQGPEILSGDLDVINRMFDPTDTHTDGTKGGIGKGNLNFDLGDTGSDTEESMAETLGSRPIDGLEDVDNPSKLADKVWTQIKSVLNKLNLHKNDKSNPHDVGSAQVTDEVYGNVSNSTKTLKAHIDNKGNPHTVTSTQVTDGNYANVKEATDTLKAHTGNTSNPHAVNATQVADENYTTVKGASDTLKSHIQNVNNPHAVNATQVTDTAYNNVASATSTLKAHIDNKFNPHSTTKEHVGLGLVDNVKLGTAATRNVGVETGNLPAVMDNGRLPSSVIPAYGNFRYAGDWKAGNVYESTDTSDVIDLVTHNGFTYYCTKSHTAESVTRYYTDFSSKGSDWTSTEGTAKLQYTAADGLCLLDATRAGLYGRLSFSYPFETWNTGSYLYGNSLTIPITREFTGNWNFKVNASIDTRANDTQQGSIHILFYDENNKIRMWLGMIDSNNDAQRIDMSMKHATASSSTASNISIANSESYNGVPFNLEIYSVNNTVEAKLNGTKVGESQSANFSIGEIKSMRIIMGSNEYFTNGSSTGKLKLFNMELTSEIPYSPYLDIFSDNWEPFRINVSNTIDITIPANSWNSAGIAKVEIPLVTQFSTGVVTARFTGSEERNKFKWYDIDIFRHDEGFIEFKAFGNIPEDEIYINLVLYA